MDWPNFVAGIFFSILPKRYWGRWNYSSTADFRHSAIASGLIESAVSLYLLILGYSRFLAFRAHQMSFLSSTNEGTQLYMLGVVTIDYLLHPGPMFVAYSVGEGAIRAIAAWSTGEVFPVLPIKVVQLIHRVVFTRNNARSSARTVPDRVEHVSGRNCQLRIASGTPKEGWRESVTIAINDELYEIEGIENGTAPRPFVYLLRNKIPGAVIRGFYRYEIT